MKSPLLLIASAMLLTSCPATTFAADGLVQMEIGRLRNGLRYVLSPDQNAKTVFCILAFDVGSANERTGETGIAHLFEHLKFEGSEHVKKGDHWKLIARAGGSNNAFTNYELTAYVESVSPRWYKLPVYLEADRLRFFGVTLANKKLIEEQREVVINERRLRVDENPMGLAFEEARRLTYPEGHPLHHPVIGFRKNLDEMNNDAIVNFDKTHYAPNRAWLVLTGKFEPKKTLEAIHEYFDAIAAGPESQTPDQRMDLNLGGVRREVLEHRNVTMPVMVVSYPVPGSQTEEHTALEAAADLLTAGDSTPLTKSLVREKRLAVNVGSGLHGTRDSDMLTFQIMAMGDKVPLELLEKEFLSGIERWSAAGPTEQELEDYKKATEYKEVSGLESMQGRGSAIGRVAATRGDPRLVNVQDYKALTVEQVRAAARTYLRADNRVVVTMIPQTKKEGK